MLTSVGAYQVEGLGVHLFDKIDGDQATILGSAVAAAACIFARRRQSRGMTLQAFVIGWPISHSRSPLIHNYWLAKLNLPGRYERFAVAPPDLPTFLVNLTDLGFVAAMSRCRIRKKPSQLAP